MKSTCNNAGHFNIRYKKYYWSIVTRVRIYTYLWKIRVCRNAQNIQDIVHFTILNTKLLKLLFKLYINKALFATVIKFLIDYTFVLPNFHVLNSIPKNMKFHKCPQSNNYCSKYKANDLNNSFFLLVSSDVIFYQA